MKFLITFHFENLILFLIIFNIFRSVYFLFQCFFLIKNLDFIFYGYFNKSTAFIILLEFL